MARVGNVMTTKYVINSKTGLRETVNNVRLGDVYLDFTMGINNTFTYKGVTLSFLIDIRHGGSLYSETVANLRSSGLAAETTAHREDASFIEPGVILFQDDGTYRPNDVPVKSMQGLLAAYIQFLVIMKGISIMHHL